MSKLTHYLWLVLLLPNIVFSQQWEIQSGEKQLAVLELFTSEGCGLCPAAERWVHNLPENGVTESDLLVLGFHIDYLNDKKAWVDKFAKPEFSERQRQLARLNLYQSVYTPEFIISGEVVHNWKKHAKKVIKAVNDFEVEASISLKVERVTEQLNVHSQVNVLGDENRQYSKLYLAVIENNVSNKVHGGDNAGVLFNHQNLVRKWIGPIELKDSGNSDVITNIEMDQQWDLSQLSIAAVVQNLNDGFVLQGLVLPLK